MISITNHKGLYKAKIGFCQVNNLSIYFKVKIKLKKMLFCP